MWDHRVALAKKAAIWQNKIDSANSEKNFWLRRRGRYGTLKYVLLFNMCLLYPFTIFICDIVPFIFSATILLETNILQIIFFILILLCLVFIFLKIHSITDQFYFKIEITAIIKFLAIASLFIIVIQFIPINEKTCPNCHDWIVLISNSIFMFEDFILFYITTGHIKPKLEQLRLKEMQVKDPLGYKRELKAAQEKKAERYKFLAKLSFLQNKIKSISTENSKDGSQLKPKKVKYNRDANGNLIANNNSTNNFTNPSPKMNTNSNSNTKPLPSPNPFILSGNSNQSLSTNTNSSFHKGSLKLLRNGHERAGLQQNSVPSKLDDMGTRLQSQSTTATFGTSGTSATIVRFNHVPHVSPYLPPRKLSTATATATATGTGTTGPTQGVSKMSYKAIPGGLMTGLSGEDRMDHNSMVMANSNVNRMTKHTSNDLMNALNPNGGNGLNGLNGLNGIIKGNDNLGGISEVVSRSGSDSIPSDKSSYTPYQYVFNVVDFVTSPMNNNINNTSNINIDHDGGYDVQSQSNADTIVDCNSAGHKRDRSASNSSNKTSTTTGTGTITRTITNNNLLTPDYIYNTNKLKSRSSGKQNGIIQIMSKWIKGSKLNLNKNNDNNNNNNNNSNGNHNKNNYNDKHGHSAIDARYTNVSLNDEKSQSSVTQGSPTVNGSINGNNNGNNSKRKKSKNMLVKKTYIVTRQGYKTQNNNNHNNHSNNNLNNSNRSDDINSINNSNNNREESRSRSYSRSKSRSSRASSYRGMTRFGSRTPNYRRNTGYGGYYNFSFGRGGATNGLTSGTNGKNKSRYHSSFHFSDRYGKNGNFNGNNIYNFKKRDSRIIRSQSFSRTPMAVVSQTNEGVHEYKSKQRNMKDNNNDDNNNNNNSNRINDKDMELDEGNVHFNEENLKKNENSRIYNNDNNRIKFTNRSSNSFTNTNTNTNDVIGKQKTLSARTNNNHNMNDEHYFNILEDSPSKSPLKPFIDDGPNGAPMNDNNDNRNINNNDIGDNVINLLLNYGHGRRPSKSLIPSKSGQSQTRTQTQTQTMQSVPTQTLTQLTIDRDNNINNNNNNNNNSMMTVPTTTNTLSNLNIVSGDVVDDPETLAIGERTQTQTQTQTLSFKHQSTPTLDGLPREIEEIGDNNRGTSKSKSITNENSAPSHNYNITPYHTMTDLQIPDPDSTKEKNINISFSSVIVNSANYAAFNNSNSNGNTMTNMNNMNNMNNVNKSHSLMPGSKSPKSNSVPLDIQGAKLQIQTRETISQSTTIIEKKNVQNKNIHSNDCLPLGHCSPATITPHTTSDLLRHGGHSPIVPNQPESGRVNPTSASGHLNVVNVLDESQAGILGTPMDTIDQLPKLPKQRSRSFGPTDKEKRFSQSKLGIGECGIASPHSHHSNTSHESRVSPLGGATPITQQPSLLHSFSALESISPRFSHNNRRLRTRSNMDFHLSQMNIKLHQHGNGNGNGNSNGTGHFQSSPMSDFFTNSPLLNRNSPYYVGNGDQFMLDDRDKGNNKRRNSKKRRSMSLPRDNSVNNNNNNNNNNNEQSVDNTRIMVHDDDNREISLNGNGGNGNQSLGKHSRSGSRFGGFKNLGRRGRSGSINLIRGFPIFQRNNGINNSSNNGKKRGRNGNETGNGRQRRLSHSAQSMTMRGLTFGLGNNYNENNSNNRGNNNEKWKKSKKKRKKGHQPNYSDNFAEMLKDNADFLAHDFNNGMDYAMEASFDAIDRRYNRTRNNSKRGRWKRNRRNNSRGDLDSSNILMNQEIIDDGKVQFELDDPLFICMSEKVGFSFLAGMLFKFFTFFWFFNVTRDIDCNVVMKQSLWGIYRPFGGRI